MATPGELTDSRPVSDVLAWSRDLVEPALRTAVDTLPGLTRTVAGYHFGWWDEHGQQAGVTGGKLIRPALVLLSAEAAGGVPAAAVPAAVAVELVHNFSLLHDDVMDGDATRRHRPTAWSVFGANAAILAGDALVTLAFDVLAAAAHPAARDGLRMLSAAVLDLIEGQCADLSFEDRSDVELAECVSMAKGKTAALLGCCCALGAAFGGGRGDQVSDLRMFGECLGLAFQLVDDMLGIWGDSAATGKPAYSDLTSRKKSLPVVAALRSDTSAGGELTTLYQRPEPLSRAELARTAELIDGAGGRSWSQQQVNQLLTKALRQLRTAEPARRAAAELEALAHLVTQRDR